jgi:type IV pilus assembly protein PilC
MAYPGVMLVIAIAVTIFLLTFVLPKFEPLFNREGFVLPTPTLVLLTLSGALLGYWMYWLGGVAALIGGFLYARRTPIGRQTLDWLKLRLPILGSMNRKVALSRSVRTLGSMVAAGVSVLDAIELSAEVCGNYHYAQSWHRVLDRVTQGEQICDVLRTDPLFPSTLVQMIAAGEDTGKLDMVLAKISDHYDQEVDAALKTTTSMIEPIMITIMGVVVGGIGMGLMLPIFKLSSHTG